VFAPKTNGFVVAQLAFSYERQRIILPRMITRGLPSKYVDTLSGRTI
jgi:hypothetical protein